MIGLDFPVRPEWIHNVHELWQPDQPIVNLMALAKREAIAEISGEEAQRKRLTIILRYFVGTEGNANSRVTLSKDVWVTYSRLYPPSVMSPAYLAHLIAQNKVVAELTRFAQKRYEPSDEILSGTVRQHASAQFGERRVVTNTASAFLRTLQHFEVLADAKGVGHYRYVSPLSVDCEVFPLLVWSWWQKHLAPQIPLDAFLGDPAFAFLEKDNFGACWKAYRSELWSIEERIEGRRAVLRHADAPGFVKALLELN